MEIRRVSDISINDYIGFCKMVYRNNPYHRDIMSPTLKTILSGKAAICSGSFIEPVLVWDKGRIVAACTFAVVDRMPDMLQMAYFEALDDQNEAVALLVAHGRNLAKARGIGKMMAGLNLHVNYGLGFLANRFDSVQSFGSAYNPPSYIDYFSRHAAEEVNLVSYLVDMEKFEIRVEERLMARARKKYRVRNADFKKIEREASIYTSLNNAAFSRHRFYYERRDQEDLELFRDFKRFLKEENLLFMEFEGKPVGFMLWYPDFNELMTPGETIGVRTYFKNILFGRKIGRFKIVELGVLPEHQKNGAVLTLFDGCRKRVGNRFKSCEAGWILSDNLDSRGFAYRWADEEHKRYKVFIMDVRKGNG